MEYVLSEEFGAEVPEGTSLLFHGSALSGKREASFGTLARGFEDGEASLVVCFESRPEDAVAALSEKSGLKKSELQQHVGILNASVETAALKEFSVKEVDSPADLTGVGIRLSRLLSDLREDHRGVRVLYDSLSAPLMYRETKTVYRFLRKTVGDCTSEGALVVAVLDTSMPDDYETERFFGLFDGNVEFRSVDGNVEYMPQNVADLPSSWNTLSEGGSKPPSVSEEALGATEEKPKGNGRSEREVADVIPETIASLHDLSEAVLGSRQTVTVFNHSGGNIEGLRSYFDTFGVEISTADSDSGPADFAVLHQGDEFLAAAPLGALATAVEVEAIDIDGVPEDHFGQLLLAHVDQSAFAARDVWRRFLIRMSRHIELRALRSATGTFHAGFQELSRVYDDYGTRGVYSEMADSGVDVHIYGVPDIEDLSEFDDAFTVHQEENDEIATTWFLVYTDGGNRSATLVAEEKEDGRYHGFWSFEEDVAQKAAEYIEKTYPETKRASGD